MSFWKKGELIGLDIGSEAIKVAEVVQTKKGCVLKKFGVVTISPGVIEKGGINDFQTATDSIRRLFRKHHIKNRKVALSIGGASVIIKKISIRNTNQDQIYNLIKSEAEQYVPYNMNEVNFDFQILGKNHASPKKLDVLFVAASKDMVNNYVKLVQMASLKPCIIDVDLVALQNLFNLNYQANNQNIMLIDIGAAKTSINILKNNYSLFIQEIPVGSGEINKKIVSAIDCTYEESEQIKINRDSNLISKHDLKQIILSIVENWSTEFSHALDFFYSIHPENRINIIILSGGGSNVVEFREVIKMQTSAEPEIINPFQRFKIDKTCFKFSCLKELAPQAAICIGLSIRKKPGKLDFNY